MPEGNGAQLDEGGVSIGEFIVADSNAPELLEAVDEPLDRVAVAVGEWVQVGRLPAVGAGWNHCYRAGFGDLGTDSVGNIDRIGRHLPGRGQPRGGQVAGLRGVAGLPRRQDKGQQAAGPVTGHVQLSGKATAATPERPAQRAASAEPRLSLAAIPRRPTRQGSNDASSAQ